MDPFIEPNRAIQIRGKTEILILFRLVLTADGNFIV
jgi:hypothetical protein